MRKSVLIIISALAALVPSTTAAQYNSRQNIELQCYGGRNQMQFHVCACDQSGVSGAVAMTLGNVSRRWGPGSQADCLAWANQMNGVGPSHSGSAGQTPSRPPAAVQPPTALPTQDRIPSVAGPVATPQKPLQPPGDIKLGPLYKNWNNDDGAGCAKAIHTADMRISKDAYVEKVTLRINWRGQGSAIKGRWASLHSSKHTRRLTFRRGNCSPAASGPDWCQGSAEIRGIMPAGQYSINVFKPILCRNSKSGNTGFSQIWGTFETDWVNAESNIDMLDAHAAPIRLNAKPAYSASLPAGSQTLIDNWNTGGCGLTDTSRFQLSKDARVAKLETWVKWQVVSGGSLKATLQGTEGSEMMATLSFRRGECHPNMPDWCKGVAQLNSVMPRGLYVLQAAASAMCVNAGSGNTGYMRIIGALTLDESAAFPDDKNYGDVKQRRPRHLDLPKLSYKLPKLGMPGNRSGDGARDLRAEMLYGPKAEKSSAASVESMPGHSAVTPLDQPAKKSGIQVMQATYGKNCGAAVGNVTRHIASQCDGRATCSYVIDYQIIGDPVYGCAKNYLVDYRCSQGRSKSAAASPEAGYRKKIFLSCPEVESSTRGKASKTGPDQLEQITSTSSWTFCSREHERCSFEGEKEVRYGMDGKFVYKLLNDGTPCDNKVFGDPNYGVVKACYYRNLIVETHQATPDGDVKLRKRRTRKLPNFSYKPPKLGMPGNRRGSAGGSRYRGFGPR